MPLQQPEGHERRRPLQSCSFTNRRKAAHLCGGDWQGGSDAFLILCGEREEEESRLLRFRATAVRVSRCCPSVLFDASLDNAVRDGEHLVNEVGETVVFGATALNILGGVNGLLRHDRRSGPCRSAKVNRCRFGVLPTCW